MSELDDLIAEQDRDRKAGSMQWHEPFVAFSLDQVSHLAEVSPGDFSPLIDVLHTDDGFRVPSSNKNRPWSGCPIHGVGAMRYLPCGKLYCRECNVDNQRAIRRAKGMKPQKHCPHGNDFRRTTKGGNRYCTECRRITNGKRYPNARAKDLGLKT